MQRLAAEIGQPGNVGPAELAQRAGAAHEKARAQRVAALGGELPAAAGFIEGGFGEPRAEPQVSDQAVLFGHLLHVGLDFGRRGEAARPAGVGRERERIGRRGHVDMRTGIGVVPPGAAEPRLLFEDDEIVDAGALELHGHAQTGHAGAEDDHLVPRGDRRRGVGQRPVREARDACDGRVGAGQRAAMHLEHMPAPLGDVALDVDTGGGERVVQRHRLVVQQLVGAGLDQGGRQTAQVGVERRRKR